VAALKAWHREQRLVRRGLDRLHGPEVPQERDAHAIADALDSVEDADRRARANYYYGQLQVVRELKDALG
jgi:hypothetical protein